MNFPQDDSEAYTLTIPTMGSVIDLRWIPAIDRKESPSKLRDVFQSVIERWVDVMSDYQQDSQVNLFCRKADDGNWHQPGDDLWRILMLCNDWNRWSEGAFDASLGAITRLRRSKKPITDVQWEQASKSCGWNHLEWDLPNRRVRFSKTGIRLDFGAIGKGFVVDRIADQFSDLGIERFSVNASGNMALGLGPIQDQNGWAITIGLVNEPKQNLRSVRLEKCGIATSGDLHQKFPDRPIQASADRSINEALATSSHILDPANRTGLTGSMMATVITDNATNADAFATACCVHSDRGTLRQWLSQVESHRYEFHSDFEIWVQNLPMHETVPTVIHWD